MVRWITCCVAGFVNGNLTLALLAVVLVMIKIIHANDTLTWAIILLKKQILLNPAWHALDNFMELNSFPYRPTCNRQVSVETVWWDVLKINMTIKIVFTANFVFSFFLLSLHPQWRYWDFWRRNKFELPEIGHFTPAHELLNEENTTHYENHWVSESTMKDYMREIIVHYVNNVHDEGGGVSR